MESNCESYHHASADSSPSSSSSSYLSKPPVTYEFLCMKPLNLPPPDYNQTSSSSYITNQNSEMMKHASWRKFHITKEFWQTQTSELYMPLVTIAPECSGSFACAVLWYKL
jgi:hypothetical protein